MWVDVDNLTANEVEDIITHGGILDDDRVYIPVR